MMRRNEVNLSMCFVIFLRFRVWCDSNKSFYNIMGYSGKDLARVDIGVFRSDGWIHREESDHKGPNCYGESARRASTARLCQGSILSSRTSVYLTCLRIEVVPSFKFFSEQPLCSPCLLRWFFRHFLTAETRRHGEHRGCSENPTLGPTRI